MSWEDILKNTQPKHIRELINHWATNFPDDMKINFEGGEDSDPVKFTVEVDREVSYYAPNEKEVLPIQYENEELLQYFKANPIKPNKKGKFGFKAVAERVRWESYFTKGDGYKWSNSVTTYAGKKFIEQYPQFSNQVSFKGENNE